MAVDTWLDTQCGVPEITVSPDECSCEDNSKVGHFSVKFKVQSRMARLHHLDARYVATQYQYLKQFVVLNRNETIMVCMDYKAVVLVGNPGMPLSTGVRSHNSILAPTEGCELVAMDHNFWINIVLSHIFKIPSVALFAQWKYKKKFPLVPFYKIKNPKIKFFLVVDKKKPPLIWILKISNPRT